MTNLRDLLAGAVPDLAEPENRVAEVGARVRRQARWAGTATAVVIAVAVGAAVGVPNLGNGTGRPAVDEAAPPGQAVTVGADECPAPGTDYQPSNKDAPGPLVPAGATEVALCEVPSPLPGSPAQKPPPLRVLTSGVDDVVRVLNELPGTERYKQLVREREIAAGRSDPGPIELGCTGVGYPYDISLRLRYPDREPVYVLLERNCGTARVGDVTRHWWPKSPLVTFFARYRDQLAATVGAARVAGAACWQTIPAERILRDKLPSGPNDGIALNREGSDLVLPNDLVAGAVCRYTVDANGATLTAKKERRGGDLIPLRDAINQQFATEGQDGPKQPRAECGDPMAPLPRQMDVVHVSDETGATSEFWLYRSPCAAAIRAGYGGLVPTSAFGSAIDTLLR